MKSSRLHLNYERNTVAIVFNNGANVAAFAFLSAILSVFYLFLLPSLPLGTFTFYAIRFISPIQVAFAVAFGTLISLVIVLNVYAFRVNASSGKRLTVGSVLASLVNGLCCTPLIPSLIALSGASTPVLFKYSPEIQAFFAFNYVYFYLLSVFLLLVSIHYLAKKYLLLQHKGEIEIGEMRAV